MFTIIKPFLLATSRGPLTLTSTKANQVLAPQPWRLGHRDPRWGSSQVFQLWCDWRTMNKTIKPWDFGSWSSKRRIYSWRWARTWWRPKTCTILTHRNRWSSWIGCAQNIRSAGALATPSQRLGARTKLHSGRQQYRPGSAWSDMGWYGLIWIGNDWNNHNNLKPGLINHSLLTRGGTSPIVIIWSKEV